MLILTHSVETALLETITWLMQSVLLMEVNAWMDTSGWSGFYQHSLVYISQMHVCFPKKSVHISKT